MPARVAGGRRGPHTRDLQVVPHAALSNAALHLGARSAASGAAAALLALSAAGPIAAPPAASAHGAASHLAEGPHQPVAARADRYRCTPPSKQAAPTTLGDLNFHHR